mmetsp:Transcript_122403/g.172258  ORF Transcript_122403/g.172258 Transcript_122403/m.172258 type:complete len:86 (-) Transcript_122403:528-785(-)
MGVSVGGLHLEDTARDLQDGHIEGASTQIVHRDDLAVSLVQTIRKSSSRGLVDDTQNVEASDLASVLGGLALRVVEVRRHSDHRL